MCEKFIAKRLIIFIALLVGLRADLPALADGPLLLTGTVDGYAVGPHLELLADESKQLTLEQVASPAYDDQFVPSREVVPHFGYTTSAHWARFQIKHALVQPTDWLLEYDDPTLDSLQLYVWPQQATGASPREMAGFRHWQTGDQYPRSTRDVDARNFVFRLNLAPEQTYTVYLRIENRGATPLPVWLWTPAAFAQNNSLAQFGFGFFYGLIFVMACYNLFLFAFVRERIYLYYVLTIVSLGLYFAQLDGLAQQFMWPDQIWWGDVSILVFIGLTLAGGLRFGTVFLVTKSYTPRLKPLLNLLTIIALGLVLGSLIPAAYHWVAQLLAGLTVLVVVVGVGTSFSVWRQGYNPALYFLLAWSGIFLGAVGVVGRQFDLLSVNFFTDYGVRIGTFLLVLLLSLALADRINELKRRAEAANKYFRQREQAEAELSQYRQRLEELVAQRTDELATVNSRLKQDIVKLQQAEQKIQEQNRFLYHVLESISTPFYVINVDDYSIEIANSAARRIDVTERATCFAITRALDAPCQDERHPCPMAEVVESGQATVVEHTHRTPTGQTQIFEVHGFPIFNEQGQVVQMIEYLLDVTKRKQAETELRKLSRAVEQSAGAVVITDLDGNIEFVNPAFTKITGYSYEEVLGENTRLLKSGQNSPQLYKELWQTIVQDRVWQGELINKKKNGELYWEFATITPVKDENNRTTHYLAIKEDVTERKKAEEALQQRSQQLALINRASQIFSSTLELDEVIQKILSEMHELLDILATSYWLLVPETGELVCKQASGPGSKILIGWRLAPGQGITSHAAELGEPIIVSDTSRETRHYKGVDKKTGLSLRSLLAIPLRVKGEVIGVLNLADEKVGRFSESDLALLEPIAAVAASAIKNARLFEETQRQQQMTESLRQVALALNSSLDQEIVIPKILEQLRRVIQYDSAGLFLQDGSDLVLTSGANLAEEHMGFRIPIDSPVRTARVFREKQPIITPDVRRDPYWQAEKTSGLILSWMAAPLLAGDEAIGVLTIDSFKLDTYTSQDARVLQTFVNQAAVAIQNARLFDEAQRQRQAMELALADLKATQNQLIVQEKMASLGMLTAGIAHEIKNPLNFVTSFAQLSIELAQDLRDLLEEQTLAPATESEIKRILDDLQANASNITEEGYRANSIVQSMLLHSRGGSSEPQETDLNSLLNEAVNLAFHSLKAKEDDFAVIIETDYDPKLEPLSVIPQDLSRVFVNLVNNAYAATREKSMMENGEFEARLMISTEDLDHSVKIRIRDNGSGISVAEQQKLFTPFFTTKPTGQGTGLGLSISYDIIQGHQGAIVVDSEVGEYTEFIITLPKKGKRGETYGG